MSFPYAEIEDKIGYAFRDRALLKQAFTHASYGKFHRVPDNERLEYLGDAVLEMVVTEWQYENDSRAEGKLSAARQRLVCKLALESAVDGLGIYEYLLRVGRQQNLGDKSKSNLFEAVAAAIYLDGGYLAAKRFILEHGNVGFQEEDQNYKGALQEFLQGRGEPPPAYVSRKQGPDHLPVFYCTVTAMGESATAQGKSIKEAEALSAFRLLWELEQKYGTQKKKKK